MSFADEFERRVEQRKAAEQRQQIEDQIGKRVDQVPTERPEKLISGLFSFATDQLHSLIMTAALDNGVSAAVANNIATQVAQRAFGSFTGDA